MRLFGFLTSRWTGHLATCRPLGSTPSNRKGAGDTEPCPRSRLSSAARFAAVLNLNAEALPFQSEQRRYTSSETVLVRLSVWFWGGNSSAGGECSAAASFLLSCLHLEENRGRGSKGRDGRLVKRDLGESDDNATLQHSSSDTGRRSSGNLSQKFR